MSTSQPHDHDPDHDHGGAEHVHDPDRELAVPPWRVRPDTVPIRAPHVVGTEVDGNLIIAHPRSLRVVRFDPINALLWRSFGPGVTVQDLADDLVDGLGVDPQAALDTLTFIVTDLARAGFLTEPDDPPSVRTQHWWPIDPTSEQGKRLGIERLGPEHSFVIDTGGGLVRTSSTDLEIVEWLRHRFADVLVAADDPRTDGEIETLRGVTGLPAANRRPRHRSTDHYGNVWFTTFDLAEHAESLARALHARLEEAEGGTWLRLAALVAAGSSNKPGERSDRAEPVPAVLVHPWGLPTLERLLPGLRRAGVEAHAAPMLRYDPGTGRIDVAASPRFPTADEHLSATRLEPVALVGARTEDDLGPAEVVERFGHAARRFDQVHLEAVAHLVAACPYRTVDGDAGLRSITEQLAGIVRG